MTTPVLPELDENLGFNLDRVAQLYRRELVRALAAHDLSPEQWQLLAALASHREGLTQGEIGAVTSKDKHSVSRMLDRMEEAGWVARRPHPADARACSVVLGRRGSELGAVRAALRSHFTRINGHLTDAQHGQLLGLLKVLRARLEE